MGLSEFDRTWRTGVLGLCLPPPVDRLLVLCADMRLQNEFLGDAIDEDEALRDWLLQALPETQTAPPAAGKPRAKPSGSKIATTLGRGRMRELAIAHCLEERPDETPGPGELDRYLPRMRAIASWVADRRIPFETEACLAAAYWDRAVPKPEEHDWTRALAGADLAHRLGKRLATFPHASLAFAGGLCIGLGACVYQLATPQTADGPAAKKSKKDAPPPEADLVLSSLRERQLTGFSSLDIAALIALQSELLTPLAVALRGLATPAIFDHSGGRVDPGVYELSGVLAIAWTLTTPRADGQPETSHERRWSSLGPGLREFAQSKLKMDARALNRELTRG